MDNDYNKLVSDKIYRRNKSQYPLEQTAKLIAEKFVSSIKGSSIFTSSKDGCCCVDNLTTTFISGNPDFRKGLNNRSVKANITENIMYKTNTENDFGMYSNCTIVNGKRINGERINVERNNGEKINGERINGGRSNGQRINGIKVNYLNVFIL